MFKPELFFFTLFWLGLGLGLAFYRSDSVFIPAQRVKKGLWRKVTIFDVI